MPRSPRIKAVLDASALLAYLFEEPGGQQVGGTDFERLAISSVNLTEVETKLLDNGVPLEALPAYPMQILPFDAITARIAADLWHNLRTYGLGLGDCSCLATARLRGLPVWTTDQMWKGLDHGVDVFLLR